MYMQKYILCYTWYMTRNVARGSKSPQDKARKVSHGKN